EGRAYAERALDRLVEGEGERDARVVVRMNGGDRHAEREDHPRADLGFDEVERLDARGALLGGHVGHEGAHRAAAAAWRHDEPLAVRAEAATRRGGDPATEPSGIVREGSKEIEAGPIVEGRGHGSRYHQTRAILRCTLARWHRSGWHMQRLAQSFPPRRV